MLKISVEKFLKIIKIIFSGKMYIGLHVDMDEKPAIFYLIHNVPCAFKC